MPLLRMTGISKRFAATQALQDVSLDVVAGRVLALIGENGAGKSTLMKVLAGVTRPDQGRMEVDGHVYAPRNPAAGRAAGVAMIHQELSLAPHLSVEANILLGQEQSRWGWVRRGKHRQVAREALARLGAAGIDLNAPAGTLSLPQQQLVEIARALASRARVLVLDEPTSSLTESDAARLLACLRELRGEGLGIVYISHFLEEVGQVADDYVVLRDGAVVARGAWRETTLSAVVAAMVGRDLNELFPHVPHQPGECLLDARGLSGSPQPLAIDLELRRGEVFGLAGLVGAGRSELLRSIYGLQKPVSGVTRRATRDGWQTVLPRPRQAIRQRLGFVSENRKEEGLALGLSVTDNLTLSSLERFSRGGWIRARARERRVDELLTRLSTKVASGQQAVGELSGGNQQKVALARLLAQEAEVLLLDEPTRGIDIGSKAEIYRLIGELAAAGKAVLMVSSYLPELLNVCDRIGVMCRGRLREVRAARDWSEVAIMHVATGGEATMEASNDH